MAGTSLLTLIDDIASLLDDVALMTKVAAKKTTGVLGDDLALNAEQVSGVRAERELPVVWAVAKGSFKNKVVLVPSGLALSFFAPKLIIPLLILGGAYLCFEGVEKILHSFLHPATPTEKNAHVEAVANPNIDLVAFEEEKIKGAIRTDFVLSAEIIVITLGSVAAASFIQQVMVIAGIAIIMTVGVYGLVAGIVRLDDMGLYLTQPHQGKAPNPFKKKIGQGLLIGAPILMKGLSIVGTVAMFMVGGQIIVHGIPSLHHAIEAVQHNVAANSPVLASITSSILDIITGIVVGGLTVLAVKLLDKAGLIAKVQQVMRKK